MKTLTLLLTLTGLLWGADLDSIKNNVGGDVDLLQYETRVVAITKDVYPTIETEVTALSIKPYKGRFLVLPKTGKKFVCDEYIILREE